MPLSQRISEFIAALLIIPALYFLATFQEPRATPYILLAISLMIASSVYHKNK